jgi:two-component system response regulator (stage 0 sporulation protein A)
MADNDQNAVASVSDYLKSVDDMEMVTTLFRPEQVVPAVAKHRPDLLLMDFMRQGQGQALLEDLGILDRNLRIVIFSKEGDASTIAQATSAGAAYYILKPFDMPTLVQRLRQFLTPSQAMVDSTYESEHLWTEVHRYLEHLGVPVRFKGFSYLSTAIVLCFHDATYLNRVTKALYPSIARQWHTTPQRVERAIRYALEVTWTQGNLGAIDELFRYTVDQNRAKPTNASFIAHLVDAIRLGQVEAETL